MKRAIAVLVLFFWGQLAFAQCSFAPLSTFPESPNWSRQVVTNFSGTEVMEVVAWRKDCFDGTADLLMTFRPLQGTPFFCESNFSIRQNGASYSNIEFVSNPSVGIPTGCPSIFFDTTYYIDQKDFLPNWDPLQAFTLLFDFGQPLDVGAFIPAGAGGGGGGGGGTPPRPDMPLRDFELALPSAWGDPAREGDFSIASLPNNFTLPTVVPKGCLTVTPTRFNAPPSDVIFDDVFAISDWIGEQQSVRIRVWRQGCHEPGRSAILMNLELVEEAAAVWFQIPFVYLATSPSAPSVFGYVSEFATQTTTEMPLLPTTGLFNSALRVGGAVIQSGTTYVIDAFKHDMTPSAYNQSLSMTLDFGQDQWIEYSVPSYSTVLDGEQLPAPAIHGRYTGQWTAEGLPRSGLVLQVGETAPDRNFVFAIWFTYLDGLPVWVVGNADIPIGASEVEIPMAILDGGGFITAPGSFTRDDVTVNPVGTMTLRAIHCNRMEAQINFAEAGLGSETLQMNRLIRIAGYDCDQTQ